MFEDDDFLLLFTENDKPDPAPVYPRNDFEACIVIVGSIFTFIAILAVICSPILF